MSFSFINEAWNDAPETQFVQSVPENADLLIRNPQDRVRREQIPLAEPHVSVEPVTECKQQIAALEDYVKHLKDVINEINSRIPVPAVNVASKPYQINDLIIYIALGAFVIFVLDSFTKINK